MRSARLVRRVAFGAALDYVDKSRSFAILRRRIDLIRGAARGGAANGEELPELSDGNVRVGNLALHGAEGKATWKGRDVGLTLTEFRMVHLLAMRAGQGQELATRDEPARSEVYGEFHRIQEAERQAAASVTMQALGWRRGGRYLQLQDDIATVAYWYQTLPIAPYPELPDRQNREIV